MIARPMTVLIASNREWSSRSLESILGPHGYTVLKSFNAEQTLERLAVNPPDAVILDADLPGGNGLEICRAMAASPGAKAVPILVTVAGPVTRQYSLEALRAGAWGVLGDLPLDAEELLLRLQVYTQAKLVADHARDEGLLDYATGLYNLRGLLRRAAEMSAEAGRRDMSLACLAISPQPPETSGAGPGAVSPALDRFLPRLRSTSRASDILGRLGPNEVILLAPHTDAEGAARLAQRISELGNGEGAAGQQERRAERLRPCVGYCAVSSFRDACADPVDLLVRATLALRRAQTDAHRSRIQAAELSRPAPAADLG